MNIQDLKKALYHTANGIWSGIPLCCIRYFVMEDYRGTHLRRGCDKTNYIRCDSCFKRDYVKPMRDNGVIWYGLLLK